MEHNVTYKTQDEKSKCTKLGLLGWKWVNWRSSGTNALGYFKYRRKHLHKLNYPNALLTESLLCLRTTVEHTHTHTHTNTHAHRNNTFYNEMWFYFQFQLVKMLHMYLLIYFFCLLEEVIENNSQWLENHFVDLFIVHYDYFICRLTHK